MYLNNILSIFCKQSCPVCISLHKYYHYLLYIYTLTSLFEWYVAKYYLIYVHMQINYRSYVSLVSYLKMLATRSVELLSMFVAKETRCVFGLLQQTIRKLPSRLGLFLSFFLILFFYLIYSMLYSIDYYPLTLKYL